MPFIFILIFWTQMVHGQSQPLFRIEENDRVGYMNAKGEIVIKPVYLAGNDFSDGLAAVRLHGLYGFIDQTGKTIIEPQFDLATNFVRGLAVVYKNGKPYFINKNGAVAFPAVYKSLTFIDDQKGIITTLANRVGVIDIASKKLIIDTVYSSIDAFNSGVAIVKEFNKKRRTERLAVIDSLGKLIVPFGKYETISAFNDGYAKVTIEASGRQEGSTDGVIDTKGNLIFKRPYKNNTFLAGDFHDGFAKMGLYKYWIPEEKGVYSTSEKSYEGFINLKGEIVLNDTNYKYVNDFSCGRTFARKKGDNYILLNNNFQQIGNASFERVLNDGFQNGKAIVETEDGFGIIDTTGRFLVRPQFEEISEVGIVGEYFFYKTYRDDDKELYGIADLNGNRITKPIMTDFARNGFVNGLLLAVVESKLTYIDQEGNIVWQQKPDDTLTLKPLNIDYMNRGYCYAYSTPAMPGEDRSGGWATSSNKPQKISADLFPANQLAVTIDTTRIDSFATKYFGYKLFISNTTTDTIQFDAQDSRLYLKLQAQDRNGEWKDIEYLPSSWCGNSYHTLALEPNAFWSFTIPKYEGEFPTKIRAALQLQRGKDPGKQKTVYSNIINASINPGQFWNKRAYYPNGIMDPYFD